MILFQIWEASNTKGLSKQTFQAAKVTTLNIIHLVNYLLDAKKLDYILLGSIQSDYLEGRFGWYRQLCGANYFNSVLQFLQAEKKIRLRSLVKLGFNMSSIKDIFNESNQAKVAEIAFCTSRLLDEITDYKFEDTMQVLPSDQAIVFYTAGYIGRSIMKNVKGKDTALKCYLLIAI